MFSRGVRHMWRRIRICVATLVVIALLAVATAQAVHAWRNTEGLDSGSDCSKQVAAASRAATMSASTSCEPGDTQCKLAAQGEAVAKLQFTVAELSKVAHEALEKAEHAASAATKVAKAANQAHQARQHALKSAVAPLAHTGSPPLAAPPASKGDIASMAKSS